MLDIVEEFFCKEDRVIMAVGAADTGKSTLLAELAARLAEDECVGLVDADIGQSHLGPPATVSWGRFESGAAGWEGAALHDFYFTGAVSPPGNLLQLLTGAALMTASALNACNRVLVDTTGLVAGPAGIVLKQQKLDLLRPDVVVALARGDELAPILKPLELQARPRVLLLPPPPAARTRTPAGRARFRRESFARYFQGASVLTLSMAGAGLRSLRGEAVAPGEALTGRLVSLRDRWNRDRALGIVAAPGSSGGALKILTPLTDLRDISTVVISALQEVL